MGVHDATRLEWSFLVPRPADRGATAYEVELDLDVPASVFAAHDPWAQLQTATRLDGDGGGVGSEASLDELRRATVSVTQRLARAEDGLARHVRLAGSIAAAAPRSDLEGHLHVWLDAAEAVVRDARATLQDHANGADAVRARELALADEFVSTRFLEMLAGAERALTTLEASGSPHLAGYVESIEAAEDRVAAMLERELACRKERGYLSPDPDDTESLDAYVERASRLKKHFQEVLFLERESFEVVKRMHHWVAALVAVFASSWAFAWQAFLGARGAGMLGSQLLAFAAFAGFVYATKDRMKEVGRTWFFGHVQRLYGQRVVRFRAPARRLAGSDVIVRARESFDQTSERRPDPLHPDSGAEAPIVAMRFRHDGVVLPPAAPLGGREVKFVFRYDFTPLFARLADAVREVPVLDARTRRLAFREAARCYRVPVRLRVATRGARRELRAVLVLSKRGLERLEG